MADPEPPTRNRHHRHSNSPQPHRQRNREPRSRTRSPYRASRRSRSPREPAPRSRPRSSDSSHPKPSRSHHSSQPKRRYRSPSASRSPSPRPRPRRSPPPPRSTKPRLKSPPPERSRAPLPSQEVAFSGGPEAPTKQQPNFAPSGLLAAETNTVAGTGVVLKYHEPAEARKPAPRDEWRMYVFKGEKTVATVELGERSAWLFGREAAVADVETAHPSCSKQHAVLQFRFTVKKGEFGEKEGAVRLYVIDLESANGTRVNGEKVPEGRYLEVRSGDVLRFGDSERDYVLLLPPG